MRRIRLAYSSELQSTLIRGTNYFFLQAKGLVEVKAGKLPLDGQWYWDKKLFYIVEMRVLTPWDVQLLMFVQMMPKN